MRPGRGVYIPAAGGLLDRPPRLALTVIQEIASHARACATRAREGVGKSLKKGASARPWQPECAHFSDSNVDGMEFGLRKLET